MAKKNIAIAENAENIVAAPATLRELMTANVNVSLAKLAEACDAPYAGVRAKAKQPVEGQPYDPSAINYEAIELYLLKRNDKLNFAELDWTELNKKTERQTRVLKNSSIDFSVGQSYYLRYFKSVWTIVYATETHVCMMPADMSSTQPKVMAKTTFVSCGVKPADYQPADKAEKVAEN